MRLREGSTRPFTDYRSGDPFVLREFSEKLHQLVLNELGTSTLVPVRNDVRSLKGRFAGRAARPVSLDEMEEAIARAATEPGRATGFTHLALSVLDHRA